jgi:biotin carboxylase
MKNPSICVAFIDPIISPGYLVEQLHKNKIKVIAVYTLTSLSASEKKLRFRPDLFDHVIYVKAKQTAASIASKLKALKTDYVFYGYEGSVIFTDQVSQLLCPAYSNNPKTQLARFNKYAMQVALQKARIPQVKQFQINKILTKAQQRILKRWKFPVIVKPTDGTGSVGVRECFTASEVKNFIQGKAHGMFHTKSAQHYVVQERLQGDEYFVDTSSFAGKHCVVSVQHYKKISFSGHPIYRYLGVVNPKSMAWKISAAYTLKVLNAAGIQNALVHTEIFLTPKGPRLIEINPRISGASGFANKIATYALGHNQPETLAKQLKGQACQTSNKLMQYTRVVFLQSWQPHKMRSLNVKLLKKLAAYREHLLLKEPGTLLAIPETLLDTVGFVLLAHPKKKQLLADYHQLLEWEQKKRLF